MLCVHISLCMQVDIYACNYTYMHVFFGDLSGLRTLTEARMVPCGREWMMHSLGMFKHSGVPSESTAHDGSSHSLGLLHTGAFFMRRVAFRYDASRRAFDHVIFCDIFCILQPVRRLLGDERAGGDRSA